MRLNSTDRGQRGAAIVEFAIAGVVFMTALFAVVEFGRLLWVHNALTDAARRGARYAVTHAPSGAAGAQRMAVYGTTEDGASPMVTGLKPENVKVEYSAGFNVGEGTATVSIQDYEFRFVVPLVGTTLKMPAYASTLTAENAGQVPANLP